MIEFEKWKSIPEFDNYQISNMGSVKNVKNNKIRKASPPSAKTKYYKIILYQGGHTKTFDIHRLVGQVFCQKPVTDEYLEIHHINGNTFDNRATNLKWVTRSQNRRYSKPSKKGYLIKDMSIVWYDENGIIQGIFDDCMKAAQGTGFSHSAITKVCSKSYPRATHVGRYGFERVPTKDAIKLAQQQKKSLTTGMAKD